MFALRSFGDASIGFTAGNGREGAGDIDLLRDGVELNDDRRLGVNTGGFIGSGSDIGVPGADGVGEAIGCDKSVRCCER